MNSLIIRGHQILILGMPLNVGGDELAFRHNPTPLGSDGIEHSSRKHRTDAAPLYSFRHFRMEKVDGPIILVTVCDQGCRPVHLQFVAPGRGVLLNMSHRLLLPPPKRRHEPQDQVCQFGRAAARLNVAKSPEE